MPTESKEHHVLKKNEGPIDRMIRVLLGCVLLAVALSSGLDSTWGIIALIAAIAMLATGILGVCGLYRVFGISTCPIPKPPAPGNDTSSH
jgi:hypothetical protein